MFWVPQWKSFWIVSSDGGRECEAIMQVNEEDTLYRVTTPSVSKVGKHNDFILLASRRKPCDSRWFRGKTSLLIACRVCSIFLRRALSYSPQRSILDRPAFCQFAHPSAYWQLHPGRGALCWVHNQGGVRKSHQGQLNADKETQSKRFSPTQCLTQWVWFQITYYNQATPGVLPYIATDIVGLSSSFYSSFSACSHFLEANKDVLTATSLWPPHPHPIRPRTITLSLFTCCRNSRLGIFDSSL